MTNANRKIAIQAINHVRLLISTMGPSVSVGEEGNTGFASGGVGKGIGRTEAPFPPFFTSSCFLRLRCFVVTVLTLPTYLRNVLWGLER